MGRKRSETRRSKMARMLIEEYKPESIADIQEALKDLLDGAMEDMLKAELNEHLDYEYGESPLSVSTRNGTSKKNSKIERRRNRTGYSKR